MGKQNIGMKNALEMINRYDLKEKYGVKRIGFFGSFVRSEQKEIRISISYLSLKRVLKLLIII